ncbi:MAG TPA: CHASE domain-containing protein [Solirubrobacteraceae bacterium]|nr:CHASE domain-containing protein [Solirubrobacteraceae bacterium]
MTVGLDVRPTRARLDRSVAVRLALPASILLAAIVLHFIAAACGERREHDARRAHAEEAAELLGARVAQYGDALYAIRGLFAASTEVTHREFRETTAATAVARRFPGVHVIGFAPLLEPEAAARAERDLRRSAAASRLGYPRFDLPDAAGRAIAPIAYVEPVAGNARASTSATTIASSSCSSGCTATTRWRARASASRSARR